MTLMHSSTEPTLPADNTSNNNNDPFAFVIVSHPSRGKDAVLQKQVRRHVAYRWHEDARRRSSKIVKRQPRALAQKGQEPDENQQLCTVQDVETTNSGAEDSAEITTSETALTSPRTGPGLVGHLGSGRGDPFNSCAIRISTMESFLLDHYFQTFAAKVSAIYSSAESAEVQLSGMPREWVSFLITDTGILAGVFLRACRTLSVVTSKQYLGKLALKYRARCIEALSTKIASMSTALSIEAIAMMLMLTTDEFYMGSATSMRYHVNAMQRVVKLKGGLQDTALEGIILRLIEWNDLQCTLLARNEGQPRRYPAVDILTSGFPVFS
ncbi:uncharacterized protein LY89DRAFT_679159 [Mollisia scopiformis]|uniref:Uncharacterized protein n=1 Tax=Mollisia scopiformis TaxID=149040 RepID=A0A194XV14_MOLSC|nr:uncharacterized protein LY89DRAFT_679159 [Mollisia scopiformis]KUJ23874.1 hypothetical protein LY89DRAFT_679159 [Mollisia scopiformis]